MFDYLFDSLCLSRTAPSPLERILMSSSKFTPIAAGGIHHGKHHRLNPNSGSEVWNGRERVLERDVVQKYAFANQSSVLSYRSTQKPKTKNQSYLVDRNISHARIFSAFSKKQSKPNALKNSLRAKTNSYCYLNSKKSKGIDSSLPTHGRRQFCLSVLIIFLLELRNVPKS